MRDALGKAFEDLPGDLVIVNDLIVGLFLDQYLCAQNKLLLALS